MLLCFNSIKVKVFYALECWNTASPEKKNYLKKMEIVGLSGPESVFFLSYMGRDPCAVSQCPVWSSPLMSLHAGAGSVSHEFVVVVVLDGQAAMEIAGPALHDCHK